MYATGELPCALEYPETRQTFPVLDCARDEADHALVRMTAQMPIRFTHIFMGGDSGPWASGFVSGCVRDPEAVRESSVFMDATAAMLAVIVLANAKAARTITASMAAVVTSVKITVFTRYFPRGTVVKASA